MKDWIWHAKYGWRKAVYVGSYYNISHEPDTETIFISEPKFKSELTGVFKRESKPNKIGFR